MPKAPKVDVKNVSAETSQRTAAVLAQVKDPQERLIKAGQMDDDARAKVPELRRRRNHLFVTLYAHTDLIALNATAGISRTQAFYVRSEALGTLAGASVDRGDLAAIATAAGFPPPVDVDAAVAELHDIGEKIVHFDALSASAREVRDDLIRSLVASGSMRQQEVADAIGRNPSLIHRQTMKTAL